MLSRLLYSIYSMKNIHTSDPGLSPLNQEYFNGPHAIGPLAPTRQSSRAGEQMADGTGTGGRRVICLSKYSVVFP